MLVTEDSLPEVYSLAVQERSLGKMYVFVDLEPRAPVSKYVQLWEGILGTVVGRQFYDDDGTEWNSERRSARTVRAVTLRVRIADITEAMRRFKKREATEIAAPIAANQVAPVKSANTAR